MRKILEIRNSYEAVLVLDEVIADLRYVFNQKQKQKLHIKMLEKNYIR